MKRTIKKYNIYVVLAILIASFFFYKSIYEVGVEKEYYHPGDTVRGSLWGSVGAVNYGDGYSPICDNDNVYIYVEVRDPNGKLMKTHLDVEEECRSYIPISWSFKLSESAKLGTYSVKSYYCADIGCSFGEKHNFGSTTFRVVPSCNDECSSGKTKCVGYKYYTCGNYDSDPCFEWSHGEIKIGKCGVNCKRDSDCPSGYSCIDYKCKFEAECSSGETKCEGYHYYVCKNRKWEYRGIVIGKCGVDCYSGDTRCVGYNYYMCSNYEWSNEGKKIGECGVECLEDNDCPSGYTCNEYKCESTEKTCEDYGYFSSPLTCDSGTPETISVDNLICYTGKCITTEKTCEDYGYFSSSTICDSGTPETILIDGLTCYTGECIIEKTCEDYGYFSNPPVCNLGTPEKTLVDDLICYTGECDISGLEPFEFDWKYVILIAAVSIFGIVLYWYFKK